MRLCLEYVSRYATEEALQEQEKMANGNGTTEESDSDESTLSDFSENETETMELWQVACADKLVELLSRDSKTALSRFCF